jgi:hypothetical protein
MLKKLVSELLSGDKMAAGSITGEGLRKEITAHRNNAKN